MRKKSLRHWSEKYVGRGFCEGGSTGGGVHWRERDCVVVAFTDETDEKVVDIRKQQFIAWEKNLKPASKSVVRWEVYKSIEEGNGGHDLNYSWEVQPYRKETDRREQGNWGGPPMYPKRRNHPLREGEEIKSKRCHEVRGPTTAQWVK